MRAESSLLVWLAFVWSTALARPAAAQSEAELTAGRALFAEALADEEHQRFAAALAKYERVKALRDTPQIRFRIASALEGAGRLVAASDAYASAAALAGATTATKDVELAARSKTSALARRIGHLRLLMPTVLAPATTVRVDGVAVGPAERASYPVDPGVHVVTATAPDARPFGAQVTVVEGSSQDVRIALDPAVTQLGAPGASARSDGAPPTRTLGIGAMIAGGAVAAGGAIVLGIRASTISDLRSSCPDGTCPSSRHDELQSTHDRALVEGPIGVSLLAVGGALVATGFVLFAVAPSSDRPPAAVGLLPVAGGATFTFTRGL
ncbi:MAG: hypothetical protein JWP97_1620 [Labilithrix sp.]|nr:hypothetical protein [Labilithrix sp.]